ncbi:MAG: alpha-(1-_3)-arabinofuranosyltransferase family protein [Microthrixaceae bacterium]
MTGDHVAATPPQRRLATWLRGVPLLVWIGLGTFLLALLAAALSSPGRYVADARFEIYWGTGRYLRSQLSLWDGVRNLGRPNPYFSPVIGAVVGALRLIGLSPAWAERVLHAMMISLGATGAAAVMARHRPHDRLAVVMVALIYGFNPVVAEFLVPSGIFFHYALAPLLVLCVRGALTDPPEGDATSPWRWPARTALVVFAMGAINSASLLYAFLPAAITAVAMVAGERRARLRALWSYAWRTALASLACGAAALVVLAVNGPVVEANLSVTELPETVSAHSSWAESLRGLGYWLTYFGGGGTTQPHPSPFVLNFWAAAASLLVPLAALVVLIRTRWRPARTYGWMLLVALVAMVGLYPVSDGYPLGDALSWMYEAFPTSRFLRNGYKAGAGWAMAVAMLVAVGTSELGTHLTKRRDRRATGLGPRRLLGAAAAVGVLGAAVPFWNTNLYPPAETTAGLPDYWRDATAYLNRLPDDGRVLILPGANRTRYRWGYIGDDLFDALLSQPHVARSTLPQGTPQAADLINAIDRYITGPDYSPGVIGPILARLGIRWVVLRNDLDWQQMGAPRPSQFNGLRSDPDLSVVASFGSPGEFTTDPDATGARDAPPDELDLPPVQVFEVADSPGMVRTDPRPPLLVAGSGETWPGLSQAGLLNDSGPVRYLPTLSAATTQQLLETGSGLVISDGNRRRVQRGTAEANFLSPTLPEGADGNDRPARPLFDGAGQQTTADYGDATAITASAYGAPSQMFPLAFRPSNATDNNPRSAWGISGFGSPKGESLTIALDEPTKVDRVSITQVRNPADTPTITRISVTDDQGRSIGYDLGTATSTLSLPGRAVSSLTFRIDQVNAQSPAAVGFTEIALFDTNNERLDLAERLELPDVPDASSAGELARYAFERSRLGAPLVEEPGLARSFTTAGGARNYDVRVWGQVGIDTPDVVLDNVNNREVGAFGSSRFQGRLAGSGSGAVDARGGKLGRSWEAAPISGESLTLRLPEQRIGSLALLTPGSEDVESSSIETVFVSGLRDDQTVFSNVKAFLNQQCAPEASEAAERCLARTDIDLPDADVDRVVIRVGAVSAIANAAGPLPIRITEVGIDGRIGFGKVGARRDGNECTPMLSVDGTEVGVRVTDSQEELAADQLELATCNTVGLRPGEHRLDTTLGGQGLISRVLLTPTDTPAPTGSPAAEARSRAASLTELGRTVVAADLSLPGPTQVIIGQAAGAGWSASFDGESSQRSIALDTLAGWEVEGSPSEMVAVYTPQRTYTAALAITILAVAVAAVVAVGPRRWRRRP